MGCCHCSEPMRGCLAGGGKGISTADILYDGTAGEYPENLKIYPERYYTYHTGNDFYHRYKEDIALMAEMGFKAYRFQLLGQESCLKELVKSIQKELNTTTMSSMNV